MPRLRAELEGPPLWIKRDDCTGLAVGGNKTRKLEFLVGEARAQRADTLLSFGALQSNHARQTAAAASQVGLACHLVLVDKVAYREAAYESSGNVLLDQLLGAVVHVVKSDEEAAQAARRIIDAEQAAGRRVYAIPTGGSSAVGALGYVGCAQELVRQARELDVKLGTLVTATSSAGTQAGLVAGFAALGEPVHVLGINVYRDGPAVLEAELAKLVDEVATTIEIPPVPATSLHVRHDFLGPGYGVPTPAMREAVELTAQCEGILLDPVYTGKAMAGLIELVRRGELGNSEESEDGAVVFLHTGGSPGLFAYREALVAD